MPNGGLTNSPSTIPPAGSLPGTTTTRLGLAEFDAAADRYVDRHDQPVVDDQHAEHDDVAGHALTVR